MSAQIICSGLAQAALWATSMPTITAVTRAAAASWLTTLCELELGTALLVAEVH